MAAWQPRLPGVIERHSIDPVPAYERHGHPRSGFSLWFSANMQVTTIVTGALGIYLGLDLRWALIAIGVGNAAGAVFMALHAAQGPRVGVPQMVQSRAQFGFYGALLPLLLALVMYVGFFASSGVLGGQALEVWSGLPLGRSIEYLAAACAFLAVVGYRLIHAYERAVAVGFAAAFFYLTVRFISQHDLAPLLAAHRLATGPFLLLVAVTATWQITWAPYVADYSRYLPERTSTSSAYWWTYGGSVLGAAWMMALGATAAAAAGPAFRANPVAYLTGLVPGTWSGVYFAVFVLGVVAVNVLNLYGIVLATVATLSSLPSQGRRWSGAGPRAGLVLAAAAVGTAVARFGAGNFLTNYRDFLQLVLYLVVPWSAVNLTDFYLVRHQRYDVAAMYNPAGRYGAWGWRGLSAYVVGVALELPFMNTAMWTGGVATALGGADVSWVIGLVVPAVVYVATVYPTRDRSRAPRYVDLLRPRPMPPRATRPGRLG